MKWLLSLFAKRRKLAHAGTTATMCLYHDEKVFPDVLATEYCKECDMKLCYMCSNQHHHHGHHVNWAYPHTPVTNELTKHFHRGCKVSLNCESLKCVCGKDWASGPQPTICIACGTATCSAECHMEHVQAPGHCLFYTNFTPTQTVFEDINGFRAILIQNIRMVKPGMKVTQASPRFMTAVKSSEKLTLTIQRGFRQYGNPLPSTASAMSVLETTSDYEFRVCDCTCYACAQAAPHPVYNCNHYCEKKVDVKKLGFVECWCICSVCVMRGGHSRLDCYSTCVANKVDKT